MKDRKDTIRHKERKIEQRRKESKEKRKKTG